MNEYIANSLKATTRSKRGQGNNTVNLAPFTHEEEDTRMVLHAAEAVQEGHRKIVLRTVDTDVLVLSDSTCREAPGATS